jgi:hypothetical protein
MRTKTLLLTAAALAAGLATSMAQSNVYSVNVVVYINKTFADNSLEMVQNPLNDQTNTLNSTLINLGSGSVAYVWNGAGYDISTRGKAVWNPDLSIPTGVGLFVKRSGTVGTNTFVGSVVAESGKSVTNKLTANMLTMTGSLIPYADTLNSTNGLGLVGAPSGSVIYQWNGSGYTISTRGKAVWNPDLTIGVGEGFFIKASSDYDWVQTLSGN